jgi:hypothetical protein
MEASDIGGGLGWGELFMGWPRLWEGLTSLLQTFVQDR